MSDDDSEAGFLGRWAKRKAQVRAQENAEPAESVVPQGELPSKQTAPKTAEEEAEPFDLASLPSLDDITASTDVTAFLRREVPEFLRNAALKRAWAADPGIRDYVNPAMEYAYDWNVIGGVPGSGELEAGYDAASQVAQMFSTRVKVKDEKTDEESYTLVAGVSADSLPEADERPATDPAPSAEFAAVAIRLSTDVELVKPEQKQIIVACEPGSPGRAAADFPSLSAGARRRHGGAVPDSNCFWAPLGHIGNSYGVIEAHWKFRLFGIKIVGKRFRGGTRTG